jgi:hypothetical protein
MAKKKVAAKVNKSQAIRDYKEKNPEAGPTAIAAALTAKGVAVKAAQVSNALSKPKANKKPSRKPTLKAAAPLATAVTSNIDQLKSAAKLIAECGGVEEAAKALKDAGEIVKAFG